MLRDVRLIVLWLLCAALPLQGAAATAMALCGPVHPSTGAAMTHVVPPMVHGHGVADGSHHHASPDAVSDEAHHQDSTTTCSVCASCCLGGGPLSHAVALEFGQPRDTFAHPLSADRSAYVTGGLERPPRPFFA